MDHSCAKKKLRSQTQHGVQSENHVVTPLALILMFAREAALIHTKKETLIQGDP